MQGIIITINLLGSLEGFKRHTTSQKYSVKVSGDKKNTDKIITRKIIHSNRINSTCQKVLRISEEIINSWVKDKCPSWEKPFHWNKMTLKQKIQSHVDTFDEGFGVAFDTIN